MQHRHTRKSAVRLAGAALAAALSLGLAAAASADQLQDILAAKKLRVAIDLGVPPYGMKDAALKSTGSDVETARLLAQDLGVELEIVPTTGANRVPFLQTNKADIVISSMSITPERQKVVDFSVPYAAILAVVGAPRSMTLTSAADLANKKVIATRGTTNDAELTKIAPKDAQIIRFDDDATSITAVVSGQADIFATAPALLRTINDKAPAKQMESKFVMRLNMLGIGLRKNEPALKARLDGWVRDNLQNGKLNAVYKEFHGVNLPPEVQGPAAERPEATMARIASVEIFLVDLLPKVVRTDAVQSFERQETPIVRITDSDGAVGVGYSYTIGTGGSAVARLLDEHLAPMLPGREAGDVEGLWRELMYRVHATTVGALTSIALAAIDTALWDLRAPRRPAVAPAGRRRQGPHPALHHRGRLAAPADRGAGRGRGAGRAEGFHGAKLKVGRPHVAEDVARIAAVREAVGDDWDIMVDANQGFRCPRRSAARAPSSRWTLPGWKSRSTPTTCTRTGGCRPRPRCRSRWASRCTACRSSRTICRATPARWCRWTWAASAASRRG